MGLLICIFFRTALKMEINSRLNLRLVEISVFFLFEKKHLENLPPNWHNLDLTKIWQGWICRGKIGSCGWSLRPSYVIILKTILTNVVYRCMFTFCCSFSESPAVTEAASKESQAVIVTAFKEFIAVHCWVWEYTRVNVADSEPI